MGSRPAGPQWQRVGESSGAAISKRSGYVQRLLRPFNVVSLALGIDCGLCLRDGGEQQVICTSSEGHPGRSSAAWRVR
jgi:hypothetical protein